MKLLLNAPAVVELVKLDPDGVVELAKGAAQQVAQEIARRLTREAMNGAIKTAVDDKLREGRRGFQTAVGPAAQQLIVNEAARVFAERMDAKVQGSLRQAVDVLVEEYWKAHEERLLKSLEDKVDAAVRDRLVALFANSTQKRKD